MLVGMMGSGKSAVGAELAKRLGRVFYDTDRLVEKRKGCSIEAMFRERGEAYFRVAESDVVREVAHQAPGVIATGGGVLLRQENREVLQQQGILIWLKADVQSILARTGGTARPLLKGQAQPARIEQLLAERTPYYAVAALDIETTGKSIGEVTQTILDQLEGAGMERRGYQ